MKKRCLSFLAMLAILFSSFAFSAGAQAAEPSMQTTAVALTLDEAVYPTYLANLENVSNPSAVRMLFWLTPQSSYTIANAESSAATVGTDGDGYVFQYRGLSAKQMTDNVYSRLYVNQGGVDYYGNLVKYSALQYVKMVEADATLSQDATLTAMLDGMLEYGALAQTHFGYRTDRLANATYYKIAVVGGKFADGFGFEYVKSGADVTVTAVVPDGRQFLNWKDSSDSIVGAEESLTVTATGDETYTATIDTPSTDPVYSEGLEFTSNGDGTCYVSGIGTCTDTDIVIPLTSPAGDSVTSIGFGAFDSCTGLTSVTIPESVESIGSYAFSNCSSLTSVTIPNSVVSIGYCAFEGCSSLESLTIPFVGATKDGTSNTYFGYIFGASSYSDNSSYVPGSLKTVVITGGTSIGEVAFVGCSGLTSVTVPNSVTSIGEVAFVGCSGLTSITVEAGNTKYHSAGNCLIETASKTLIAGCKNSVIPNDGSVTSIGEVAFVGCSGLTSVTVPNSMTSIGDWAFYGCTGLTSVTIPESVESIGEAAFVGCSGLTSITVEAGNTKYHSAGNCLIETASKTLIAGCKNSVIPNDGSVTSIGDGAFYGCTGLTSVTIPESVESIGEAAFAGCTGLTSVTIPESVEIIGDSAFANCTGLTSVTIPAGVNNIGGRAFFGCTGLQTVTFAEGSQCLSIGAYAFRGCTGLTSVTVPNSVTSIGSGAFFYCMSLTSVTIGNSVTSIGEVAFAYCVGLTSVTIPESVESIGNDAFRGDNLSNITFMDTTTWYRTSNYDDWLNKTGGTVISVTDSSANATYLEFPYPYYWYKE